MDFTPDPAQQAVADVVTSVLDRDNSWESLIAGGVTALPVPERAGGDGVGLPEIATALTEIGRHGLIGPALATLGFGAIPLLDLASSDQQDRYLSGLAKGSVLTAALNEPGSALPDRPATTFVHSRLSGTKVGVGFADNAEWMLARFKEWGFDAHIETFDVLFPTPKQRLLEMVAPTKFRAKLQEPVLAIDPTSSQTSEQLPTYNAYSADGDVTAPLVYVNYGDREDYEQLDRMGVSVKGAIVIARYPAHREAEPEWSARAQLPEARWFDLFRGGYATVDAPLHQWLNPLPFAVLLAR